MKDEEFTFPKAVRGFSYVFGNLRVEVGQRLTGDKYEHTTIDISDEDFAQTVVALTAKDGYGNISEINDLKRLRIELRGVCESQMLPGLLRWLAKALEANARLSGAQLTPDAMASGDYIKDPEVPTDDSDDEEGFDPEDERGNFLR